MVDCEEIDQFDEEDQFNEYTKNEFIPKYVSGKVCFISTAEKSSVPKLITDSRNDKF